MALFLSLLVFVECDGPLSVLGSVGALGMGLLANPLPFHNNLKVEPTVFSSCDVLRNQYCFYAPFPSPNTPIMTPSRKSKPLPHAARLRRSSRDLPSNKSKSTDPIGVLGRRKYARLSHKLTKTLLTAPDQPNPP